MMENCILADCGIESDGLDEIDGLKDIEEVCGWY